MKTLQRVALLLLAFVAAPGLAQTASITCGQQTVILTCVGTPIPPSPPIVPPAPVPTPTPAPSGCSAAPNLSWLQFKDIQLWPVPPLRGSGPGGASIAFVADAGAFPNGVELVGVDESQGSAKDYVISTCPQNFAPVGGNAMCAAIGAGSSMGPLYLRFGPARSRIIFGQTLPSLDCPLTPGGTYYINFRDYYPAYGPVSSQFVIYRRYD